MCSQNSEYSIKNVDFAFIKPKKSINFKKNISLRFTVSLRTFYAWTCVKREYLEWIVNTNTKSVFASEKYTHRQIRGMMGEKMTTLVMFSLIFSEKRRIDRRWPRWIITLRKFRRSFFLYKLVWKFCWQLWYMVLNGVNGCLISEQLSECCQQYFHIMRS